MPHSRTAVNQRLSSASAAAPNERSLVARLTRRAVRGDERAFEEIFRAYHQEIYRYCLAILHNASDAEDAMQATMAAALRALPGEDREIALKPWLYRVAHNEAISLLRGRREPVSTEDLPEPSGDSVVANVEQRERMRALVADLNALPDRQRAALVMRELSDLEYEEIGASLGCSEAAARQTVYEARMSLRARSEGREMSCEETRQAISGGDRRRLRGRRLKAHLASCESCQDFQAAIETRRTDLQALCPVLPAAAASGVLASLLGAASANASAAVAGGGVGAGVAAGGSAGAGAAGAGGAAAGLATAGAVKGASIAAAVLIAAGAGEATGVVDLPGPIDLGSETQQATPAAGAGEAAEGEGATGRPGSERALEARTKGEAASKAKGDNRAQRAKEARAKRGHKGKSKRKGRKGRGKGKGPSQPGSNGVGQGAPPPGVSTGPSGGGSPATPAPQAPSGGGGGGGASGSPGGSNGGPPSSAGKPPAKAAPRAAPPGKPSS
jgi:RNA polymerase sigma factor (sigma-70 family)